MSTRTPERLHDRNVGAVKTWIVDELTPQAAQIDSDQALSPSLLEAIARSRLLAACVPKSWGGDELDACSVGELCVALGGASASVLSLFTVHTMVSTAIGRWGTEAVRANWLPRLASGRTLAALTLSEPESGSDVTGVRTILRASGEKIVVSGTKIWASFAQIADVFLVSGLLDGRLATVLVDRSTSGVLVTPIRDMFGFRAGMLGRVEFRDCVVPASNLIGSPSFGLSQIVGSVLDHGRFCIASGCAGLAHASLTASVEYAGRREQFGKSLREHPLVQGLISQMMVDARAAWLMCRDAAHARDARRPDMVVRTTAAKFFAAQVADRCASAALQIHGAYGLTGDYPVERYLRDAKVMNIIEGSTQIQQMLVAQYADQWLSGWEEGEAGG